METEQKLFENAAKFREWLSINHRTNAGIWLVFGKKGGPKTISASEALEEALCFGWIDGLMKSIDDTMYIKYFSPRRKNSQWSDKNKAIIAGLQAQKRMSEYGQAVVDAAKQSGAWDAKKTQPIKEEQINAFTEKLAGTEPAYSNFIKMSPSVKRTYTAWFFDAKSEQSRANRLAKIIDRLNKNLKPM